MKNKEKYFKKPALNQAGQSADAMYQKCFEKFTDAWLPTIAITIFAAAWYILHLLGFKDTFFTFVIMILTMFVISYFNSRGVLKKAKAWRIGRDAERLVGQKLEELRINKCYVFHDKIPNPECNIDHLAISKSGIFVIETKARRKPIDNRKIIDIDLKNNVVKFANKKFDSKAIGQLKANMKWFEETLYLITKEKYTTRGVLIYVDSFVEPSVPKLKNIWILNQNALASFIKNERAIFSDNQVQWLAVRIETFLREQITELRI